MEWVLLITLVTPSVMVGRSWIQRKPRFALVIWFGSFLSAGLATLASFALATLVAFDSWLAMNAQALGSTNWLIALSISFLPWIFLALGGIALALMNTQLAPQIASARQISESLNLGLKVTGRFAGYPVALVELPVKMAFTIKLKGKHTIVVGRGVMSALTMAQFEAVQWHEIGHIKGRHNQLKRIAAFAHSVAPFIAASTLFSQQVELLCELEANNFALRHASIDDLTAAQKVFRF